MKELMTLNQDIRCRPLAHQIKMEHRSLRLFKPSTRMVLQQNEFFGAKQKMDEVLMDAGTALAQLDTILFHHSTSVDADEALCIGILLDLPIMEILNGPETAASRIGRV